MFMGSKHQGIAIIADGGIRNSGDAMKCFAAGADAVMCGSLLSGTFEAPGEILVDKLDGTQYKVYQGMASFNAMTDWNPERAGTTPEGVATRVRYKGHVSDVLQEFKGGLQSGCSYAGIAELKKARTNIKLVRVSESGLRESHPHIMEK
jgi:IMP dehydrogenase